MAHFAVPRAPVNAELAPDHRPETVIRADDPRLSSAHLFELLQHRQVAFAFATRYVKVKYKQTVIGLGWAVLQPLVTALTLWLLLGRVAHIPSEGSPYFAFVLAGMVPWTFFSTTVGVALDSIVRDQGLLRKVYFPREILPLSTVIASLVDLCAGLSLLLVVVAVQAARPSLAWLALPLPLLLLLVVVTAIALFVSAANVLFRDIRYAVPFLLQFGLVASPIAYSVQAIANRGGQIAYESINPMGAVIDAMRRILLHGALPDWTPFLLASVWSMVLLLAAYAFFRRLERRFADLV